jgi:hypothetical protein
MCTDVYLHINHKKKVENPREVGEAGSRHES